LFYSLWIGPRVCFKSVSDVEWKEEAERGWKMEEREASAEQQEAPPAALLFWQWSLKL